MIENYNSDVILLEAGKVGWGASSRNGGFCAFPPIKTSFKKLQKIYGKEETKFFFKNSVEGSNYTKNIIKNYNIENKFDKENNISKFKQTNILKSTKSQVEII